MPDPCGVELEDGNECGHSETPEVSVVDGPGVQYVLVQEAKT